MKSCKQILLGLVIGAFLVLLMGAYASNTFSDDSPLYYGSDRDWSMEYDEAVDDQLIWLTAGTGCTATTDPMYEIIVGASPTADQQVFGVAKGTQASNTALLTLDEDGDMVVPGTMLGHRLVEVVTAANTIAASESQTIFVLNATTEFASTLPKVADSAGCVFRFVVGAAPASADYTIVTGNSLENKIYGVVTEAEVDTTEDGPVAAAEDTVSFKDGIAVVGDWVELYSDGTNWYIIGQTAADGGVTCTQAD